MLPPGMQGSHSFLSGRRHSAELIFLFLSGGDFRRGWPLLLRLPWPAELFPIGLLIGILLVAVELPGFVLRKAN